MIDTAPQWLAENESEVHAACSGRDTIRLVGFAGLQDSHRDSKTLCLDAR